MEKALAVDELMEIMIMIMIILMMIIINVPCINANRSRILSFFTHIISLMFIEDKRITKTLYKVDDKSELIHVENEREY
jgi:hypothetical protein